MNPLFELGLDFLILLGEACVFFALCWLIAKKIDNWSIVDVAWSYGFALVGLQMLAKVLLRHRLIVIARRWRAVERFGEFAQLGVGTPFGGLAGTIFTAFIGAVVLLVLLRVLRSIGRR